MTTQEPADFPPARMSELTLQVRIEADSSAVWAALTGRIADWWPQEFFAGGVAGRREFILEDRPGGRMYEQWADGGGLLWGTVVTVEPRRRLQVTGYGFPNWGGPSQYFADWSLEETDGATEVTFSEHAIGRVSDSYTDEKTRGWQFLLDVLQAHLEGRPLPTWQD